MRVLLLEHFIIATLVGVLSLLGKVLYIITMIQELITYAICMFEKIESEAWAVTGWREDSRV